MQKCSYFVQLFSIFSSLAVFNVSADREFLIKRACDANPSLELCSHYHRIRRFQPRTVTTTRPTVAGLSKGFADWLYAAKDDVDEQEIEELEAARRNHPDERDYCDKYKKNFASYCTESRGVELDGVLQQFCINFEKSCKRNLEEAKLPFPTPKPFFSTPAPSSDKTTAEPSYCALYRSEYDKHCSRSFSSEDFCKSYKKSCLQAPEKLSKNVNLSKEINSLEEFPEDIEPEKSVNNRSTSAELPEPSPEGQGKVDEEISTYCQRYIENFHYFCVGDASNENTKFCASYHRNCPQQSQTLKGSSTFLGGGSESSSVDSGNGRKALYKGSKKEYCDKFSVNYNFYCKGSVLNEEITSKFCPSYRLACETEEPDDPFKPATTAENFPDTEITGREAPTEISEGRKRSIIGKSDLVQRTVIEDCFHIDCKCDYAYPSVQKFCNPPPLPLFLNTCRLWYNGCPKYERYHYASQFIYSKAEKGKVVEGPKNNQQFNVLSPTGESLPVNPSRDSVPVVPSDSVFSNALSQYNGFTDTRGVLHRPRSRSPFSKPGLWEPNPDNPHNRDHANKYYYAPRSVTADWLNGQLSWGAHWAVPAAGVGGTDGFSAVHFPTIGTFANIPDDYD
ncbi:unnamed protein product [Caenorhabditis auriculariae]|uniref:Uncharacterized protein n=1 Tax=Caenorhabditis auriculariae TaxID=2777116 RepID=A0A8S1HU47_9PELO|nr:unnamed protein product [Caenorhabditis auriculariae]